MKYLKINKKGCGEFLKNKDKSEYSSITEMLNTDVYNLLIWIADDSNPTFDDDIAKVNNDAERVVYENLLNKFVAFEGNKKRIKDDIDTKFKPLEDKYLINEEEPD